MWDVAAFTHKGGHGRNDDAFSYRAEGGALLCALCDGMNGACGGDTAAQYCVDAILAGLAADASPAQAIAAAQDAYLAYRETRPELKKARTTACTLCARGERAAWANLGDSRLYHFSAGRLAHVSCDDSAAYQAYLAGETAYEDIRMHPYRSRLTACVGDEAEGVPHEDAFALSARDALLLCSDGFWQYIYETEMEIDLCKARDAAQWLEFMLLRIAHRSHMQGDNLSALCCIAGELAEGEAQDGR